LGDQRVQHDGLVAFGGEPVGDVRADEARPTGHQNPHGRSASGLLGALGVVGAEHAGADGRGQVGSGRGVRPAGPAARRRVRRVEMDNPFNSLYELWRAG
jgi:hypothetical protein